MIMTRSLILALLARITAPANGLYRLHNGRVYLRDRTTGDYRAVSLTNGTLSMGETL